jgi:hypothetical protein
VAIANNREKICTNREQQNPIKSINGIAVVLSLAYLYFCKRNKAEKKSSVRLLKHFAAVEI